MVMIIFTLLLRLHRNLHLRPPFPIQAPIPKPVPQWRHPPVIHLILPSVRFTLSSWTFMPRGAQGKPFLTISIHRVKTAPPDRISTSADDIASLLRQHFRIVYPLPLTTLLVFFEMASVASDIAVTSDILLSCRAQLSL